MREKRNLYRMFEGKRPLQKYLHRWEDDIKMDLRKIEWDIMVWIHLAQDGDQWSALVSTVMKLRVS
jgi:hypothetical protein